MVEQQGKAGARFLLYSYFMGFRQPGGTRNSIFVPVPPISKKNKRAQQVCAGAVIPRWLLSKINPRISDLGDFT